MECCFCCSIYIHKEAWFKSHWKECICYYIDMSQSVFRTFDITWHSLISLDKSNGNFSKIQNSIRAFVSVISSITFIYWTIVNSLLVESVKIIYWNTKHRTQAHQIKSKSDWIFQQLDWQKETIFKYLLSVHKYPLFSKLW